MNPFSMFDYSIGLLQKAEKLALELDPENGFWLAFSGGKDSQCLYHLAKMAGVKFKAHMNLTSIDPPEVIRFVRQNYPDVELIKPERSIFDMAKKKHLMPTRAIRWCCDIYKEQGGAGKVTLTGIRRAESTRRKKRNEAETSDRKFSGSFDQFSEHKEKMVACVKGKDKIIFSPILRWSDRHVWEFLNRYHIPHCSLYDEGNKWIGCILCPMSSYRQKVKEMRRWPHVRRNWLKTIRWFIENGYVNRNFDDPETGFKWWISGKSFEEFYANEFLQGKLDFDRQ